MVEQPAIDAPICAPAPADGSELPHPVVAIHQPNFMPWLGYFYKIAHADIFVFADMFICSPSGTYVNRNEIKTQHGPAWLTVPILKSGRSGQLIVDVQIDRLSRFEKHHLTSLRSNYGKAPYYAEIIALLEPHYRALDHNGDSLCDFNIALITSIAEALGLKTPFLRARDLGVSGQKTDLTLAVCRAVGARTYLAGTGAKVYQEDDKLMDAGIRPVYSPFRSLPYPQLFGPFQPNLSIVDTLMNCGWSGTRCLLGLEAGKS